MAVHFGFIEITLIQIHCDGNYSHFVAGQISLCEVGYIGQNYLHFLFVPHAWYMGILIFRV